MPKRKTRETKAKPPTEHPEFELLVGDKPKLLQPIPTDADSIFSLKDAMLLLNSPGENVAFIWQIEKEKRHFFLFNSEYGLHILTIIYKRGWLSQQQLITIKEPKLFERKDIKEIEKSRKGLKRTNFNRSSDNSVYRGQYRPHLDEDDRVEIVLKVVDTSKKSHILIE